jgi:hypothetical protein
LTYVCVHDDAVFAYDDSAPRGRQESVVTGRGWVGGWRVGGWAGWLAGRGGRAGGQGGRGWGRGRGGRAARAGATHTHTRS